MAENKKRRAAEELLAGSNASKKKTAAPEDNKLPPPSSSAASSSSSSRGPLSLQALATAAVRRLRHRLIGLDSLPPNLIRAIVDGSNKEELLAIETNNAQVLNSTYWDDFWMPLCKETWPPQLLATKEATTSWRSFYFLLEKDSLERLKKATERCRIQQDTLKNQAKRLVILEELPRRTTLCPPASRGRGAAASRRGKGGGNGHQITVGSLGNGRTLVAPPPATGMTAAAGFNMARKGIAPSGGGRLVALLRKQRR